MRYCAGCQRPRYRKDNKTGRGQRYCKRCHNNYQRRHRAKMKRERQAVAEFLRRNALSFESRV